MGGCANSKYAVDEDKQQVNKKEKKPFLKMPKLGIHAKSNGKKATEATAGDSTTPTANGTAVQSADHDQKHALKGEKEEIDFIDKEEAERAKSAANASTTETVKSDDDAKKEVTTYQTTVVKHTQKEGDELLQHLKDEAFKTLQGLLKQQQQQQQQQPQSPESPNTTTTKTTTASSSSNSTPETSESSPNENIIEQIKAQVVTAVGKTNQDLIHSIIDSGATLITENKVKSMSELQQELERLYPDRKSQQPTSGDGIEGVQAQISNSELVKKVVNATTGFLTAKGTEAGALLSNILANVSTGIHGVMNETEKTTVKVTRTVTEQIISGGQIKEITRVITEPVKAGASANANIQDILKNLSNGVNLSTLVNSGNTSINGDASLSPTKQVNTGTTITTSSTVEKHETMPKEKLTSSPPPSSSSISSNGLVSSSSVDTNNEELTKRQAEQVVSTVVNAAVGKMINETNGNDTAEATTNGIMTNGVMNGHHDVDEHVVNGLTEQITEENIKIEEEKTIKTSTTKIKVNGVNSNNAPTDADAFNASSELDNVQSEFYKHGKHAAEEAVKKVEINSTQAE
jgi:hypothetical protein